MIQKLCSVSGQNWKGNVEVSCWKTWLDLIIWQWAHLLLLGVTKKTYSSASGSQHCPKKRMPTVWGTRSFPRQTMCLIITLRFRAETGFLNDGICFGFSLNVVCRSVTHDTPRSVSCAMMLINIQYQRRRAAALQSACLNSPAPSRVSLNSH